MKRTGTEQRRGGFQKGQSGNPRGRPGGTPNKVTGALKEMILQALANVGGATYLEEQAAKNPTAFLTLIGKVLPLQVKQDGTEPMVPLPVTHEHHGA